MPPAEFQPTISAGERPQTYALDRAATGTGISKYVRILICAMCLLRVTRVWEPKETISST